MRNADLLELVRRERPGCSIIQRLSLPLGVVAPIAAIEEERISGYFLFQDSDCPERMGRHLRQAVACLTETWVCCSQAQARSLRALSPIQVGMRVWLDDGRIGIAAPATVRRIPNGDLAGLLNEQELAQLAAIYSTRPTAVAVAAAGTLREGERGMRAVVLSILAERTTTEPLPCPTALEVLRAVRKDFSSTPVIRL